MELSAVRQNRKPTYEVAAKLFKRIKEQSSPAPNHVGRLTAEKRWRYGTLLNPDDGLGSRTPRTHAMRVCDDNIPTVLHFVSLNGTDDAERYIQEQAKPDKPPSVGRQL